MRSSSHDDKHILLVIPSQRISGPQLALKTRRLSKCSPHGFTTIHALKSTLGHGPQSSLASIISGVAFYSLQIRSSNRKSQNQVWCHSPLTALDFSISVLLKKGLRTCVLSTTSSTVSSHTQTDPTSSARGVTRKDALDDSLMTHIASPQPITVHTRATCIFSSQHLHPALERNSHHVPTTPQNLSEVFQHHTPRVSRVAVNI